MRLAPQAGNQGDRTQLIAHAQPSFLCLWQTLLINHNCFILDNNTHPKGLGLPVDIASSNMKGVEGLEVEGISLIEP